jgi:hypothetical protein
MSPGIETTLLFLPTIFAMSSAAWFKAISSNPFIITEYHALANSDAIALPTALHKPVTIATFPLLTSSGMIYTCQ